MCVCVIICVRILLSLGTCSNKNTHIYIYNYICQSTAIELNDLYCSPNIVRVIKSRRMRWAGHVARMGEVGGCVGSWWGNRRERDH